MKKFKYINIKKKLFLYNKKRSCMKGQTLIEVLVALGVAVVIVSAVTVVSVSSLSSAQYIRDQDQTSKYAQEGIELVRSIRNSDYTTFRTYGGNNIYYCLEKDQTTLVRHTGLCTDPNIDEKYIRSIQIEQGACDTNIARITVNVAFSSGKCPSTNRYCHSSKVVSCLSTVNPIPSL